MVVVEISIAGISQGAAIVAIGYLAIKVKVMVTLVKTKETEVELGLTPVQMSEDQE